MQGKQRFIQCIIKSHLDDSSSEFLQDYLKWKSLSVENISSKMGLPNLPPKEGSCYIFTNPKVEVLTEIRNNFWDTLVVANSNYLDYKLFFELGFSKIWTDLNLLNVLPIESFESKDKSLVIWIFTGNPSLDIILKEIFESIGHKVMLPMQWIDLIETIQNYKPDCVILNWDIALESKRNCIELIDHAIQKSNHIPLILGLKNFQASGLAKNLMNGISRISHIIMTDKQMLTSIIFGLFTMKDPMVTLDIKDILDWDRPMRFQLKNLEFKEVEIIRKLHRENIQLYDFAKQFSWLLNQELFH